MEHQRPIELILARNLLSSVSTPALLMGRQGEVVFFNEAAGQLLGRRFEETGKLPVDEWINEFGPFDEEGRPIPYEEIGLVGGVRGNKPALGTFHIRSAHGDRHEVQASAFPLVSANGVQGGIVFFWPVEEAAWS
jgi:PAS domain-containing protein